MERPHAVPNCTGDIAVARGPRQRQSRRRVAAVRPIRVAEIGQFGSGEDIFNVPDEAQLAEESSFEQRSRRSSCKKRMTRTICGATSTGGRNVQHLLHYRRSRRDRGSVGILQSGIGIRTARAGVLHRRFSGHGTRPSRLLPRYDCVAVASTSAHAAARSLFGDCAAGMVAQPVLMTKARRS